MAFDAGAIVSTIGIDVSPFAKGVLQAQGIAKVFPSVVTEFLANPILGFIGILESGGHAAEGFFSIVKQQAQAMNEVGEAAKKAGVSTEFLSGIGKAFENNGSSVEGLGDALKFLNKTTGEVIDQLPGSERAAQMFERLGISTSFLRDHAHDTEGVFYAVADAISKIPDTAARTSILLELLSRSGADAGPAFAQGSKGLKAFAEDISKLGDITSEKDAEMGHSFTTLQQYVESALDGVEKAASKPILEALQAHFGDAKTGIMEFSSILDNEVSWAVQNVINFFIAHAGEIKSDLKDMVNLVESLEPSLRAALSAAQATFNFLHGSMDKLTETDADKAGGHPYVTNPGLTPAVVNDAGDKGIAQLRDAADAFSRAQSPLVGLLSQVSSGNLALHGSYATGRLPFSGPSETGFTDASARDDAASEDLALRARTSEMRLAMAAIAKEQYAGVPVDKGSIVKGVEGVKAFSDELAKASRLVGKWQEWQGQIGEDKTYSALADVIAKSRDYAGAGNSAIRGIIAGQQSNSLPVTGNANAGAAPGATNSFASVASAGGAGFDNALVPATAALSLFSTQTSSLSDLFATLGSALNQINPALTTLVQNLSGAQATAPTAPASPSTGGRATVGVTVGSINLPPLDANATSAAIASKLTPIIRGAIDRQERQANSIASAVRTKAGL